MSQMLQLHICQEKLISEVPLVNNGTFTVSGHWRTLDCTSLCTRLALIWDHTGKQSSYKSVQRKDLIKPPQKKKICILHGVGKQCDCCFHPWHPWAADITLAVADLCQATTKVDSATARLFSKAEVTMCLKPYLWVGSFLKMQTLQGRAAEHICYAICWAL